MVHGLVFIVDDEMRTVPKSSERTSEWHNRRWHEKLQSGQ